MDKFCPECKRLIEFDSYFNRYYCTSCDWRGQNMNHINDLEAIRLAIHHYEAEVKQGKEYAEPILEGLKEAYEDLSKYKKLKIWIKEKFL